MLTSGSSVHSIPADTEYEDEDEDEQKDDDNETEGEMAKDDGIKKTEYLCDICWYHYASSQKTLDTHKRASCRTIIPDQEALDAHHRHIYERKTYFCSVGTCHQRFVTEAEWFDHVTAQHSQNRDVKGATPQILPSQYRRFDLEEMRDMRQSAIAAWKKRCGFEDQEHRQIGEVYQAYYSLIAKQYFDKRGLSG